MKPRGSTPSPLPRGSALLLGAALCAFAARPAPAPDASPGVPDGLRRDYEQVTEELLCYCGCARQTLRECTCGVAFELRAEFERRLRAGEPPEAVIASYIAEHGEQSRNVPPMRGLNLVAWFGPGAAILVAAGVVLVVLRRWVRQGTAARAAAGDGSAGGPPGGVETDPLRLRVERELKEFDP